MINKEKIIKDRNKKNTNKNLNYLTLFHIHVSNKIKIISKFFNINSKDSNV